MHPHQTARPELRRPVTVLQTPNGAHVLYCDDGSVWKRESINGKFTESLPPLPGSQREAELRAPAGPAVVRAIASAAS